MTWASASSSGFIIVVKPQFLFSWRLIIVVMGFLYVINNFVLFLLCLLSSSPFGNGPKSSSPDSALLRPEIIVFGQTRNALSTSLQWPMFPRTYKWPSCWGGAHVVLRPNIFSISNLQPFITCSNGLTFRGVLTYCSSRFIEYHQWYEMEPLIRALSICIVSVHLSTETDVNLIAF